MTLLLLILFFSWRLSHSRVNEYPEKMKLISAFTGKIIDKKCHSHESGNPLSISVNFF